MKVVFLDIDGVLNRGLGKLDPVLVGYLNEITFKSGAMIVVHSSWRYGHPLWRLQAMLRAEGVRGPVYDVCPVPRDVAVKDGHFLVGESGWSVFRGAIKSQDERCIAIQRWLDEHAVESYVILDDSGALGHFVGTRNFVQTRSSVGLTPEHVRVELLVLG